MMPITVTKTMSLLIIGRTDLVLKILTAVDQVPYKN